MLWAAGLTCAQIAAQMGGVSRNAVIGKRVRLGLPDRATRPRLVREMRMLFTRQTGPGPETIRFREVTAHPELAGRTLADHLDSIGQPRTIDAAVILPLRVCSIHSLPRSMVNSTSCMLR